MSMNSRSAMAGRQCMRLNPPQHSGSSKLSKLKRSPSRLTGRCRSAAVVEQQLAPSTGQPGAVISHLLGKTVLQLNESLSAVPLLHPIGHSLPFAASLQVYSAGDEAQPSSNSTASPLVELHYVISGSGYCNNAATGFQQALSPGDSVISLHGAAQFAAGPIPQYAARAAPTHRKPQQQQQQQEATSPAWSQLLGWLQQLHTQQQPSAHPSSQQPAVQQQHHHQQQQQQLLDHQGPQQAVMEEQRGQDHNQLVMLQLLLPSELLTGELLTHQPQHCTAVAQQLPWSLTAWHLAGGGRASTPASTPVSSIHEQEVCALLATGTLSARQTRVQQHQQQHQHHQAHSLAASSPSTAGSSHSLSYEQPSQPSVDEVTGTSSANTATMHGSSTSSSAHTATMHNSSSSSSSTHVLPCLSQQQTLKRALSEVGAFRLPQQTNRLALLFGPHSTPAVSLSFGVEVFEPGHVTPLHLHKTAHELFFVLAGKGEAVFRVHDASGSGADGAVRRVVMGPGDVAVFPPGVVHGVDNPSSSDQLYCLQMMLPNEAFVEWVRSGEAVGVLDVSALQQLAAAASCG